VADGLGAARRQPPLLPERARGRPSPKEKYVGTGEIAELVAHADETIRRTRAERRERVRAELEEARGLASAADELNETAEILARAEMVAAGYHRHKGEWRRRRDD
jgi:hypothetical protein